jgi:hypothetical protein
LHKQKVPNGSKRRRPIIAQIAKIYLFSLSSEQTRCRQAGDRDGIVYGFISEKLNRDYSADLRYGDRISGVTFVTTGKFLSDYRPKHLRRVRLEESH